MAVAIKGSGLDIRKALSRKVVQLYRRMCREVIPIKTVYIIDETPAEIRHMVLLQFRKHKDAADPRIIDMLLTKGEMELEETRNQWKQRGHLMTIIKPELDPADPVLDFEEHMRRFMDGTLEHGMLTKDYSKGELTKVARQLESQIGAEEAGAKRIPGFHASSLPRELLQSAGSESGAGAQLR